ncbi:hypothetical protein [Streptomyces sp. NPDC058678]|uniref:hypothetical protein n=1 Tax=Streptomyces sp. NPDC058678 TaxID=3346595 RepID=UPI0036475853
MSGGQPWRTRVLAPGGRRQLPLFEQVPRDFGRLDPAAADLASPWLAWAKHLTHQVAEARGWGRGIRFAVNRGLAIVLTGSTEGYVIRHSEIFTPLRALDLQFGHVITVLEEMGIFRDDEEPFFERWLPERLDGTAPGIAAEAERWTRVLRDGGPRSLPRQQEPQSPAARTLSRRMLAEELTPREFTFRIHQRYGHDWP